MISTALGGELVTTTVEGRSDSASMRYPRELRSDPQRIGTEVLVPTPSGAQIPLGQLTDISITKGAPSIRTENALLSAYIYVDIRDRDIGSYVREAQQAVQEQVSFPPGYYVTRAASLSTWRAAERLKIVVPLTLVVIFLLLYLNFRRLTETLIVMLSVPFSLVGGVWLMWALATTSPLQ